MKSAFCLVGFAGVLASSSLVSAQTSPTSDPAPEEVYRLPEFTISSEKDVSYMGKEALSSTRVGVELADLPQSVTVLNRAFVDDLDPTILSKSMLYVSGAQTGTITWAVDRNIIRGFVGDGDYVDGFRTETDKNTDMNIIDHIEIIKGPSAIFVGNTLNTIGGVINKVSKSPTEHRVGTLTVQAGRWDANRADLDLGGPITADKRLTYRLLVAGQDSQSYFDHTYEKRTAIVPMLGYTFNDSTSAWIKFEKLSSHYSSYNGIPIDGRTNQILAIPTTTNLNEDTPNNWRTDRFWRLWGQVTSRLNDHVAVRLAAFASEDRQRRVESILSPLQGGSGGTITVTPTGPVLTPSYVIPPTYTVGTPVPRGTTATNPDYQPRREIQHDYILNFNTGPAAHKLLIGASAVDHPRTTRGYSSGGSATSASASTARSSAIDPFNPTYPGTVFVDFEQPPAALLELEQTFAKIYALDSASLLNNRLIFNFGASRNRFVTSRSVTNYNQITGVRAAPVTIPEQAFYKNLIQYGIVVKPLENVSVFYGHNENFASNGFSAVGELLAPQQGTQKEVGLKSTWLGGRVGFNLNYFELVQQNNAVNAFPATNPPSNVLVSGEISRGFDGDFTYSVTKNLDVVGSFALFDAHVPLPLPYNLVQQPYDGKVYTDLPVNNVSERNFSLWTRYKFSRRLKGLSVGVGINYLHKRAITDNANQEFYGYLPARTLVDAMIKYETKRFRYQVNVDNVLDKDYIYASRSNQVIVPGTPISARLSVTYKFW